MIKRLPLKWQPLFFMCKLNKLVQSDNLKLYKKAKS
jgi:hypothetical protein